MIDGYGTVLQLFPFAVNTVGFKLATVGSYDGCKESQNKQIKGSSRAFIAFFAKKTANKNQHVSSITA